MRAASSALSLLLVSALATSACDCGGDPSLTPSDGGSPASDAGPNAAVDGGHGADGGGGPSEDAGPPPLTLEERARELCLAYARGLLSLERHLALEVAPPRCAAGDGAPDVDEDEPLPIGTCGPQDPLRDLFLRALSGERVLFDDDAVRACAARGRAIRAATPTLGDLATRATGLLALPDDDACAGAVTPLVDEPGALCLHAWDCVPPLSCQADPLDSFSLKCLAPASEGARCNDQPPSDDVLALRTCDAGLACVLGVCTRRLQGGATCSDDGVPCASGLTCRAAGTCGAPANESEACVDDGDCAEGLRCDPGTLSCAPLPTPLPDGEPCAASSECAGLCSVCRPVEGSDAGSACQDRAPEGGACGLHDHCRAGLFCDEGSCAPYRALDEECGAQAPCEEGLTCALYPPPPPPDDDGGTPDAGPPLIDDDAGSDGPVCEPLRSLGQSCERNGVWTCGEGACVDGVCRAGAFDDPCLVDRDCQAGAICVSAVCTRAPRAGAPCTVDERCAEGLVCRDDRCRALPAAGEPCTPDGRCGETAFCPADAGTCEALRPPGGACTRDEQCQSAVCLSTLTCGAEAASCLTSADAFAQLLGLSLLFPLASLARRRRARRS